MSSAGSPLPRIPRPADELDVLRFRVGDMDCPSCVRKIEDRLRGVDGVVDVMGSPLSRTVTVRHGGAVDPGTLRDEMGRLGYAAHPLDEDVEPTAETFRSRSAMVTYASMALFTLGVVLRALGVDAVLVELPLYPLAAPDALFLLAAAVGGTNFFDKGLRAAWARTLDMNFLMSVAIVGAAVIGETLEAAAIAFLFSLAELLERYSVDRARAWVKSLMELAPTTARLIRDGEEVVVPADSLVPGDRVAVRPGERIPADGHVTAGHSAVDQSPITGESVPVDRGPGDTLYAGTINREGAIEVEVAKGARESTLARIVQLVEEAEARRSRTERFVERFARHYTPVVTTAAVLVVALPPLAFGAPFEPWFVRGLTLLVIACPCALVISTPVAVVSGITAAARNGVLIKGGTYLEAMGEVRTVALDKTGTLTVGHPRLLAIQPTSELREDDVLERAAAVEARSEHPVARAIVEGAEGWALTPPPAREFQAIPGSGARALLPLGEHRVVRPGALVAPAEPPDDLARAGHTVVGVEHEGRLLGWIAVADALRDEAAAAVTALRRAGVDHLVMLTGDNGPTAEAVAARAGVDEVRAELLPEAKLSAIRELTERRGPVAMVGDGINDGPALAAAAVGIAMGAAGSDTALETADIALMGDDLSKLAYLKRLSRRARGVIRQNVAFALAVKAILAVGVPLGAVSLVTAVLVGDMGVSLAVILNALRLGRVEAG